MYYFIKSNLIGEREEDYNKGTTTLFKFDQIFIDSQLIVETHLKHYLTNRFHVAVHLLSNTCRSQMMSKCGKNKKVTHKAVAE